jgi:hypothetical protein
VTRKLVGRTERVKAAETYSIVAQLSRSALSLSSLSRLSRLSLSLGSLLALSLSHLYLANPSRQFDAAVERSERESTEDVHVGEEVGAIMRRDLRRREGGDR